jgi:hypothetical protein
VDHDHVHGEAGPHRAVEVAADGEPVHHVEPLKEFDQVCPAVSLRPRLGIVGNPVVRRARLAADDGEALAVRRHGLERVQRNGDVYALGRLRPRHRVVNREVLGGPLRIQHVAEGRVQPHAVALDAVPLQGEEARQRGIVAWFIAGRDDAPLSHNGIARLDDFQVLVRVDAHKLGVLAQQCAIHLLVPGGV